MIYFSTLARFKLELLNRGFDLFFRHENPRVFVRSGCETQPQNGTPILPLFQFGGTICAELLGDNSFVHNYFLSILFLSVRGTAAQLLSFNVGANRWLTRSHSA